MNDELIAKVIEQLNLEFGSDVENLSKAEEVYSRLQDDKEKIENTLSSVSSEVPSQVTAVIKDVENVCKNIENYNNEYQTLESNFNSTKLEVEDMVANLQKYVSKIDELERLKLYLKNIQAIEIINQELDDSLNEEDDDQALLEFVRLCKLCSRLHKSKCTHLVSFIRETVHYWHNRLKDKYSKQFEEVLKSINWPMVGSNILAPVITSADKLQPIAKYLLKIELPDELQQKPVVRSSVLVTCGVPLPLPITLLVRPLRKRFVYHFCGSKQTNRLDKPEWFFTQVLTWIRDHEQFVSQWIQPVFNELGMTVDARVEFIRGLVQLTLEKLDSDLPSLQYDDALFSHAVDETLGFDKELKESFSYPEGLPSAVTILTQAQIFLRWTHLEKKFAREKMDAMLNSETAWQPFSGTEEDLLKVTEIGEAFLTLLSTVTDRYQNLPQPGHRLQFLDLQLELIDDLRVRLIQLLHSERSNPFDSNLTAILNTAFYIMTALEEWGTTPHFLMLQHYKCQLETVGKTDLTKVQVAAMQHGSVFEGSIQLLNRIVDDLLDTVCEAVMLETKARSRGYRRDRWFAMSSPHDEVSPQVTPSACPMFQVLAFKLHQLEQLLSHSLFTAAWKKIATQLNTFILEELILENTFNEGGAAQLQLDMTRNLFSALPAVHTKS
ncbi:RAD50-interacting protein 1 [Nilaparvata lugens]|uniref:RAD50-interacting protein 1 n=1 Tax=Nilaparvata lugens TaxID=108931 RepID=UPI00193DC80E|nr:RAD50-interacting protein 1 [Nilaparvata lugens]